MGVVSELSPLIRRPRRLRVNPAMRAMVSETSVAARQLILPVFVAEGLDEPRPISSMPGVVHPIRLDLEQLIRMLLALERGETRACRVVRVPSPAEEDAKRQHRERAVLVAERTAHGNRITGLLMLLGIRGVNPRRRDFLAHLDTLVTATGEPLPLCTKQALAREYERLCVSERQIKEIEATQAAAIQGTSEKVASLTREGRGASEVEQAALLLRLKGLGLIGASVLSREVFYRHFDNRREVASYFGLIPSS